MIEIEEPEFSVDSLTARMYEGAARRKIVAGSQCSTTESAAEISPAPMSNAHPSNQPLPTKIEAHPLALQPGFQPRTDDQYHVNDLLQYHDRNFIQNAYRAILKRGPDATGFKAFIESLRSGRLNKIDILARLRYSSEGRAKKVQINGLLVPAVIRQSYRVPLLGYFINWGVALARLPSMIRGQQQFEAHALAQQEMIADHFNRLNTNLGNHARETASALSRLSETTQATARQQQQRADLLVQEQQAILAGQQKAQQELLAHLMDLRRHLETRLADEIAASQRRMELLEARLAAESANRLELAQSLAHSIKTETTQLLQKQLEQATQVLEKQQQLRTELNLQSQRVTRLLEESAGRVTSPLDDSRIEVVTDELDHQLDAFYVSFEDQFRGSRTEIKERLGVYLPLLEEAGIGTQEMPVLDIGAGRGEWLELLQEKGMRARGVDHNRMLAAQCRERGLEVIEADLMSYLRELPDASLGAVTGFHIVEHLPIEILVRMLDESLRVTRPGGAVIFETPNPQNVLVGSCNFYFDPTHRNPVPSPILQFLVESRGFARVRVINLNPSDAERVEGDSDLVKRFNEYFYGPMDYAVVGWRA